MPVSLPGLKRWFGDNWSFLLLIAAIGLYFVLRTSPTGGIDSLAALDSSLNTGQPVVLEFYTNF